MKPVERKQRFWTEKRYNLVDNIGLAVNLIFCFALGLARVAANVEKFNTGAVNEDLSSWVLRLYISQTFLLVVSAVFLGDALRLLSNQFKKDKRL